MTPPPEIKRIPEKPVQTSQLSLAAPSQEKTPAGSHPTSMPFMPHMPAPTATGTIVGSRTVTEASSAAPPVIGPSFDAAYLSNPVPPYPAAARRLKLQGTATVRVLVSPDGHPRSVKLEKSSGARILDEAALQAVQHWSFVPARRGDKTIAAEVDVPVRFRLN
jgi:protein TonB